MKRSYNIWKICKWTFILTFWKPRLLHMNGQMMAQVKGFMKCATFFATLMWSHLVEKTKHVSIITCMKMGLLITFKDYKIMNYAKYFYPWSTFACFLIIKIEKTCFEALRKRIAKTLLPFKWWPPNHGFFDDGRGKLVAQCITCIIHTYMIILGI